jgi:hypothetical protein
MPDLPGVQVIQNNVGLLFLAIIRVPSVPYRTFGYLVQAALEAAKLKALNFIVVLKLHWFFKNYAQIVIGEPLVAGTRYRNLPGMPSCVFIRDGIPLH